MLVCLVNCTCITLSNLQAGIPTDGVVPGDVVPPVAGVAGTVVLEGIFPLVKIYATCVNLAT